MTKSAWSAISTQTRAGAKNPCRACGRKKWPCAYQTHEATGAVRWICGDAGELFYYANVDGHEISPREAYGEQRQDGWRPTARTRVAATEARKARKLDVSADTTDRVYRKVLTLCPLSDEHRQALLARPGMTEDMITAEGYATARTLDGIGLHMRGIEGADKVPGMPKNGSQRFDMVSGALLVPVRNKDGKIVGIRQRVDDPDGGKRYLWLQGSVPAVHIPSRSRGCSQYITITEGEIKASIASPIIGPTMSIPGVSTWEMGLREAISFVDSIRFYGVTIALDADFRRKAGVARAAASMAAWLCENRYSGQFMEWDERHGKGLDDFLTNPALPRLEDTPAYDRPTVDISGFATVRKVDADLVDELKALADRLVQEETQRRLAASTIDESLVLADDLDSCNAVEEMLDALFDPADEEVQRQQIAVAEHEFKVDSSKVALRKFMERSLQDILLDDGARRAFIAHAANLSIEECNKFGVYKPVVDLAKKIDGILAADDMHCSQYRALTSYLRCDRTEVGFAIRMARRFRGELLHAGGLGWHVWDGMVWVHDPDEVRVLAKAQQLSIEIEMEIGFAEICALAGILGPSTDAKTRGDLLGDSLAGGVIDGEMLKSSDTERRQHGQFVARTRTAAFLRAAISLLRPSLEVSPKEMDTHPHLLNTRSGVVDLRDGSLSPHNPSLLITQITMAGYNPAAPCPIWMKFFPEVMAEENGDADPEYIHYAQGYLGYTLWGVATEQKFCSVWGAGSNGKTTLFETIADVMGSYAQTIEPELVVKADSTSGAGKPRPDLLALRGARLLLASEPERGEAMAEGIVKRLTGNDKLSGRLGYSNEIVPFQIVGKFFLLCNELLRISGTNVGIWRRQEVWQFRRLWRRPDDTDPRFKDLPLVDQGLPDALRAEADGILAWLVEGAVRWHREKLRRPKRVTDASAEYRGEQDRVQQFLAERVIREARPGNNVSQTAMYTAYQEWCRAGGTAPLAKDRLKGALKDHGLVDGRNGPIGMIWKGVRLTLAPSPVYRDSQAANGWQSRRRDDDHAGNQEEPVQAPQPALVYTQH